MNNVVRLMVMVVVCVLVVHNTDDILKPLQVQIIVIFEDILFLWGSLVLSRDAIIAA